MKELIQLYGWLIASGLLLVGVSLAVLNQYLKAKNKDRETRIVWKSTTEKLKQ